MDSEEMCLVCQDVSSGYHYGVPSCNGCKTFFRRTIMKKQLFICQHEKNCPVDKSIRCACRFCRFEKCLQVGMDRSALQASRDRIGYTKRNRKSKVQEISPGSSSEMSPGECCLPSPVSPAKPLETYWSYVANREKVCNDMRLSDYLPKRSFREALCSKSLLNDPIFMNKYAVPSPKHTFTELRFITQADYHYWHEREWFVLTEYAKTFKVFELLSYADKAELVRHAAIVLPALNQAYHSPDYGPDTVVFPDGTYYDRTHEPTRPAGLNRKKYQVLDLVLKPFREIDINFNEFAAFKAITFLNPDADVSPSAKLAINEERIGVTKQLYDYMMRKDKVEKAVKRFSRLILMGTSMSKWLASRRKPFGLPISSKTSDTPVSQKNCFSGIPVIDIFMENETLCFVCQDYSSGYHYGVPSCNGCKTFFRRTVMKKQKFVCQFDQNCPVDKSIRCACRFCRFEKCLQVGMDKSALQASRDPIGYTKRTKKTERRPRKEIRSDESGESSPDRQDSPSRSFENYLSLLASREKSANELRLSSYLPKRSLKQALCSKPLLNDSIFMAKHATVSPRHSYTELRFITQDDYHYWHERDWFVLTEYAKTFKVFTSLSYHDKTELVRHAAIVIPVLNQVYNSPDHGLDTVVFPDGTYYDRTHEPTRPAGLNRKKYQVLDLVLKPFREMEINFYEFAAFKAITFLNPDADISLEAKQAINDERVLITKQLYAYMLKKDGLEKAIYRFGRLILMGTSMSKMACESKEAVWIADFFENIGFTSFAKEMFFGESLEN
ncbi:unnamed protein product [Caenorhabditis sp. 36 PRJEB53466]|nr:unnamed protein product [Caenorhabditis sp. 36 PRJEB53466]